MLDIENLTDQISKQLPTELIRFMHSAGRIASNNGQRLYLVGGAVRDLLLRKSNFDLDLVVEGDTVPFAEKLVGSDSTKIISYSKFNTVKIQYGKWLIDLASARSESYAKPGSLPIIKASSITKDMSRRDFTINAMAIHLNPEHYGKLIDLYKGTKDLKHKLVRILHVNSFADDATRIWRAIRYEQRFGFKIELNTLKLLKQNINMLDTISKDRMRYELECVFKETEPEKVFERAEKLKVLRKLHPHLKGDKWLFEKYQLARRQFYPDSPSFVIYLALLAYRLSGIEIEPLSSSLRLNKMYTVIFRDTNTLKAELKKLTYPELSRSHLYRLLESYSTEAITTNALATESAIAQQHMAFFLHNLRNIKPALNGNDLKKLGIFQGPQIKEILRHLLEARLDGKVSTRDDEVEMVKNLLTGDKGFLH